MTHLRVVARGEAAPGDIDSLHVWLDKEPRLSPGSGRPEERPKITQHPVEDPDRTPQGPGLDILVQILESGAHAAAIAAVIKDSIAEWREARRSSGDSEPPDFTVEDRGGDPE
ncbi:effector-associated constant component EACC1 [Streptomyces sp. NPDC002851]